MSEQAGGVALVAELDTTKALAALRLFQAEVSKVENSGAQISKLQESLVKSNAAMRENLAGQQAVAAELEEIIKKTNQLATAQDAEAKSSKDASNQQALAMRAQIKDAEYLNKTLEQRQQILARISAATRGQDISSLNGQQRGALSARYSNLAVTEAAGGGLAQTTLAQQQIAQREEQVAAQAAAEKEMTAAHADALKMNKALDDAAAADRVANLETIRALETQLAADAVAREKTRNAAVLAQRAAEEEEMTALHASALAENAALDKAAAAQRAEALTVEKALMAEQAAAQIAQVEARVAAEKVANTARLAQIAAENAALKEQMAIEASRTADLVASARYETNAAGSKLKTLQQIALASKAAGGGVSDSPSVAASFPSSAIRDFNSVGSEFTTIYALEAALKAAGEGGKSAAVGVKATAQEARELITILKDLATGEWSRLGGSLTRLLTISGTFDGILGLVGGSLLAVTGAVLGLGAAAVKGASEQNALNLALAQTGNYAGETESGMDAVAESAVAMGGSIGSARDVILQLAQTGRYTSEQIQLIADAASAIGGAGGNVEAFVKQIDSLKDSPTEAVYKLNEQFHFLTASEYEAIAAAERHGDAIKASQMAIDDFATTQEERSKSVIENAGLIERAWHSVKNEISGAVDALLSIGKTETTAQKIVDLQAKLSKVKDQPIGEYGVNDTSGMERDLAALQEKLKLENLDAQTQGKIAAQNQAQVQAERLLDEQRKKVATPADKRKNEEELLRKGLAPLVGLDPSEGGITQKDVDDLVAKSNAKYKDKRTPRGHIDPTNYNAAEEQAKLDADALKQAQNLLSLRTQLKQQVTEENYAYIEQLALAADQSDYDSRREKILKEIANANRNKNPGSAAQLKAELGLLEKQHSEKQAQIQLDYDAQEVQRNIQRALLDIQTIEQSRSTILSAMNTLYGSAATYDQNRIDDLTESAEIQKAQYDQAVQMVSLRDAGASDEEIALARQSNSLKLAQQIYAVEQDRQKLLFDNAKSVGDLEQATLNAIDQQIAKLEKSRTTFADVSVSGFTSGLGSANNALFQSFKSKSAADKFSTQNFTGEIGGSIYDSITKNLSQNLTEQTLKGFQSLLKLGGATSQADVAREEAQQNLALNTATMADALKITIPELLRQQLALMDGTATPSGPVGNAALTQNSGGGRSASTPDDLIGGYNKDNATSVSDQIAKSSTTIEQSKANVKTFGDEANDVMKSFGLNATTASEMLYTGVVAATQGGLQAIKNYVIAASAQLLILYAVQKLVGLAFNSGGTMGSENAGAAATSTPDDLIAGYGHADGVASIDKTGYITAPGGPKDDGGVAWLSNGESVLTAAATKYYGRDRISRMNKLAMPRFADGRVGAGAGSGSGGGTTVSISVDASNKGGSNTNVQDAAQSGKLGKDLESAVLGVFSKYSQAGGSIYTTIKQISGRP